MKNLFALLFAIVFIGAQGQVFYAQGDENFTQLTKENSPKLSDETLLFSALEKALAQQKATDNISIVDSVVFSISIDAEGKTSELNCAFGYSDNHREALKTAISTMPFVKNTQHKVAFVLATTHLDTLQYQRVNEYSTIKECDEIDSKNPIFTKSCFNYLAAYPLRQIPEPNPTNTEGAVACVFTVDNSGKVVEVSFEEGSFNPQLNDYIISKSADLVFPEGAKRNGKKVDFTIEFNDSYYDIDSSKAAEYAQQAQQYFEEDFYYHSIFYFNKAQGSGHELSHEEYKTKGLAYYFVGERNSAQYNWSQMFDKEELKGKNLHYDVSGKEVILTIKDPEKFEDKKDSNGEIFSFAVVENKPVYPGCEAEINEESKFNCFNSSIMKHVAQTFIFPKEARQKGIQGKMYINFVIEKDGSVSSVNVARGVDPLLDLEALRVICSIPQMQPAYQKGKPVRMQYTIPINARLR